MSDIAQRLVPPPPIPHNEEARLEALRTTGILDTPAEQEYDDLVKLAAAICGTPMSLISLVDADRQWFKSRLGIDIEQETRDVSFCAHVVAQDDLFVVNDARLDDRFKDNPYVTGDANIRFYAGMPLTTGEGLHVGSLCVLDTVPRRLTPEQEQALQVLSRQVVLQLELRKQMAASRRTESALRTSEAKFRRTIEHLADGVCIVDAFRGCFLDANSAMLNMLGYTHAEFCALSPFDIVAGETPEQFIENIGRMHGVLDETGVCDVGRRLYRRKDGSVLTVDIRVSHVPDDEGGMHAVIVRDVTEEDRVLRALHDSEQRFRLFMDSSPVVAFIKDEEGRYTYVNEPLLRNLQLRSEDIVGFTDSELFPAVFSDEWRDNDLAVLASGQMTQFAETTPAPDGSVTHWSSYKFPFRDGAGAMHLAGVGVDVSEQYAMEFSLRQSEEKFRRVVEGLSEGVMLVDLSTMKIAEVNSTFLALSACSAKNVLGRSFFELIDIDPSVMDRELGRMVETGKARVGRREMRRDDGTRIEVDVALSYVSSGGSRSMVCVLRDMTEQRAYEDQLFNYQSSLEEANGKLRAMATTDALTGARNRAAFDARIAEEHERSMRHGHPVSVVMLDVDYFKQYNDTFGHPAGDEVLKLVAETLMQSARVGDFVARYGGEEFAMILPDTDFAGSMVMAERCRRAIAARVWPNRAITASVGVATISVESTPAALIKRADSALYRAKERGRNRVASDASDSTEGAAAA